VDPSAAEEIRHSLAAFLAKISPTADQKRARLNRRAELACDLLPVQPAVIGRRTKVQQVVMLGEV
jgi:hypothetical protein